MWESHIAIRQSVPCSMRVHLMDLVRTVSSEVMLGPLQPEAASISIRLKKLQVVRPRKSQTSLQH